MVTYNFDVLIFCASQEICAQWLYIWFELVDVEFQISPPDQNLPMHLDVNQCRRGWAIWASKGHMVLMWEEDYNVTSK